MIIDQNGQKHEVVAIGRLFKDHTEFRLKFNEMYPYVDKIIVAEGRTAENMMDDDSNDPSVFRGISDPLHKLEVITYPKGPWPSMLVAMKALWDKCRVGDVVYVFGADEYMSSATWDAVLKQFAGGPEAKYYWGATRVNLPLFDLWHDMNWRSSHPFLYHERFYLKQDGQYFQSHFELYPKTLTDARMVHMNEVDDCKSAIYHTCWLKPVEHLIKRSMWYLYCDKPQMAIKMKRKMKNPKWLLNFNIPGAHIMLGKFLRNSTDGFCKFNRTHLPESLQRHPLYNYEWRQEKFDVKKLHEKIVVPNIAPGEYSEKWLYLTHDNTACVPYLTVKYLNQAGCNARLIQEVKTYINYPSGEMLRPLPTDYYKFKRNPRSCLDLLDDHARIIDAIKWADVIIWNEWVTSMEYHWLDLRPYLQGKKVVRIAHGAYYWQNYNKINQQIRNHNVIPIFTTPDMLEVCPNGTWWPIPADLHYGIKPDKTKDISITHAPTNRVVKDSALFERCIKGLPIQYIPIQRCNHKQSLSMMSLGWMHYDQLKLRAYGLSAIEGALLDSVVLVNYATYPNKNDIPFISVTRQTLKKRIKQVMGWSKEQRSQQIRLQHEYIASMHDPLTQVNKLRDVVDNFYGVFR